MKEYVIKIRIFSVETIKDNIKIRYRVIITRVIIPFMYILAGPQ